MLYNKSSIYYDNVSLKKSTTITNFGVKLITTLFDDNTWKTLYIITIYKLPKTQVSHFNSILEIIVQEMPSHCPIIIIGDFNMDFLT